MCASCIVPGASGCQPRRVGNDSLLPWVLGFALALAGCGDGGQTGQPSDGGPEDCHFDKVPPLDCCRPLEPDEPIDGLSARDILAARGDVSGVPLFWTEVPETGDALFELEPESSMQSSLSIELTLDEETPIQFCHEVSMSIPVHARVATEDGFDVEFSADWSWGPFFEAVPVGGLQGPREVFEVEGLSAGMATSCPARFAFGEVDSELVSGRFCDAERGLALFPTACGGLAQLPPTEEPPFPALEAPSETLVWSNVGLAYEDLPELNVSIELDDVSACYENAESYHVAVRLTVETGGVSFTTEAVPASTHWSDIVFNEATNEHEPGLSTGIGKVCVDVSESAAWQAVPDATDRLCIDLQQTKLESGSVRRFAEVLFDGADSGWVFLAP